MGKYKIADVAGHVSLGTSTRKGLHVERWLEKHFGSPDHIWVWKLRRCWHCNRWTPWVEINFQVALHPGFCTDEKTREYFDADRQSRLVHLLRLLFDVVNVYVGGDVKLPRDAFDSTVPRDVDALLIEVKDALAFYGYAVSK